MVPATVDLCRKGEMFAQVGNVFQEQNVVSHGDVVKEHKMLVNLSHVADMGQYGQAKFFGQDAHGQKLTDSCQSRAVGLDKMHCSALHAAELTARVP